MFPPDVMRIGVAGTRGGNGKGEGDGFAAVEGEAHAVIVRVVGGDGDPFRGGVIDLMRGVLRGMFFGGGGAAADSPKEDESGEEESGRSHGLSL